MKKLMCILMTIAMLFAGVAMAGSTETGLSKDVVVLFTSDVHCGADAGFGYAGLAAVRDTVAKDNYVVLVDNGDSIQGEPIGTMSTGEIDIDLMNEIGYDIAIPGNHEFDYGMDRFLELTQKANFPYISANFTHIDELVFKPYVIKEFDGVKIAFVGITTPRTITSSTPKYFQDENGEFVYGFCQDDTGEKLYAAVQKAIDDARAEGAAYVIAMAHLGIEESCMPWTAGEVIENTTGIDALLDGHSHSLIEQNIVTNKDGENVLHSACGTKLQAIGYLTISKDGQLSTGLYRWDNKTSLPDLVGLDNDMAKNVDKAMDELDAKLNEVVAKSAVDLVVYDPANPDVRLIRNAETNLGDLCADAYRDQTDADIAIVNGGGIRVNIPAGDITLNDILRVHPFGNELCVVEATGQQILDALEWGVRKVPSESGGFLHVSGLTYEIHTYIESSCTLDENGMFSGVDGEYRVKNVMVGDEPLDLEKTYTLAGTAYVIQNNGDGHTAFQNAPVLQDNVMIDNQALINYITQTLNGVVGAEYDDPYGQGRIIAVAEKPTE